MDDTPDKLRRNVVVLSAAILAIAIFHLSFKPTGTLLGFAQVGNVSPLKVWLALLAVLLYVVLRFHHSDDTRRECGYLAEQYCKLRHQAVIERVKADMRRYLLHGKTVRLLDDASDFFDEAVIARMERDGRAREVHQLEVEAIALRAWWEGEATISFEATWRSGAYARRGGIKPAFKLPWLDKRYATSAAVLRTAATRSRAGVDVALPYMLAVLAALTCLCKIVSNLFF